jgi:hypothetical protein
VLLLLLGQQVHSQQQQQQQQQGRGMPLHLLLHPMQQHQALLL